MSHSGGSEWSAEQHYQCVELILLARQHGLFQEVMKDVEQSELSKPKTGGAMTDAAKRARPAEVEGFEVIPTYGPSPSTMASPYPSASTEAFPTGVTSMKDWGENLVPLESSSPRSRTMICWWERQKRWCHTVHMCIPIVNREALLLWTLPTI